MTPLNSIKFFIQNKYDVDKRHLVDVRGWRMLRRSACGASPINTGSWGCGLVDAVRDSQRFGIYRIKAIRMYYD